MDNTINSLVSQTIASGGTTGAANSPWTALYQNTLGRAPTQAELNRWGNSPTVTPQQLDKFLGEARNEAVNTMPKTGAVGNIAQQILAQGNTGQWSGEGYGSPEKTAYDMAVMLAGQGITDINQLGKITKTIPAHQQDTGDGVVNVPEQQVSVFGNKQTGQEISPYYDKAGQVGADIWGGTFQGKGSTAYGVNFDASGKPTLYSKYGGSSSDAQQYAPLLGIAAGALGLPAMLGGALAPTASAAIQAGLGGAVLGGGTSALTGGNILKGALTGGALGYGGSALGDMLGSSATGPGYYNEITGQFVPDANGGLQGPLTNATSGTNLSSMANYSYDPTTGDWTSPDGTVTPTSVNPSPVTSGKDILANAGALGTGAALTNAIGTGAGSALGTSLGTGLGLSALGTGLGALANQSGISNARDLINQYGTQAQGNLAKAYADAQALNVANKADLASNYANTQGKLGDIYKQQVGFQQPYQQVGQAGTQGLIENQPYFTHQFDTNDLNTNLAPNYAFMLGQGQMANQRAANMGGGALGGNALQGLQRYTQDYAGNAYQQAFNNYNAQRNNIYNSLAGMANIGQTSTGQLANLGNTYGSNLTGLSSNYGGNLTTAAGQGINAANQYGLNTAGLATGIGSALAGNATQSGANTAGLLSNLGNTALLGSMLKAT